MIKISVIMPVYNDSDNIEESLTSLLNQSLNEIELICINDGSTDNSLNLIKKYEKKFNHIQIINQENQGSGIARNKGIEISNGEFIAFLDADDVYLDENALKVMYDNAIENHVNMVSANLKGITFDGKLVNNENLKRFTSKNIIKPEEYEIPYSFYKNIFKASFLKENHIVFPDLKRGQDPVFLAEILTSLDKISVVPLDLYGFRYAKNGGLSKINTPEKKYDYIKHFKETFDLLNKAHFNTMLDIYKEKLFYFIQSNKNNIDRDIYESIKEIFSKNQYNILRETKKLFKIDDTKVSLIIPVYNAEKFLDESINSVLNQSLKEIELICVNDGSKDNSLKILNNFSKKDSRVKVIDKPNGGCGSARNKALDNAKGEYIYFFDPDDRILPNALEQLYLNAKHNESDLVMFKIARFRDGEDIDYSNPGFNFEDVFPDANFDNFTFNYHDIKRYVLNSSFAPWSKLYRKSFLDKYDDFKFHLNVAFDDVPFHVQSVLRAEKISFIPEYFYHYRLSNPNSVNNTASNAVDIMKICDIVEKFLINEKYMEEFEKEFIHFKIKQILNYIISSNSYYFFNNAKSEFLKIKDISYIPKYLEKQFNMVLKSNTYDEYRMKIGKPLIDKPLYPKNPDISVIIPVYNSSEYLEKCIDSIIKQTYKNIEIICIDDMSTDNSLQILERYSEKDKRIRILHNTHNGAGSSRNKGLDVARGKYINFVDSDDWIDLNTYEESFLKSEKNKLDILMYQLINCEMDTRKYYKTDYYNLTSLNDISENTVFNYMDVIEKIFDIAVSPCNKLIKKELIDNLSLRFEEGIMFEDNLFFFKLFLSSHRNMITRKYYYKRRRHASSVMASTNSKLMDAMYETTQICDLFVKLGIFNIVKTKLLNYKIFFIRTHYRNIHKTYKNDYFLTMKDDFNKMVNNKYYKNELDNCLYRDTKKFFYNVLYSKNYEEFDLLMDSSLLKIYKSNINLEKKKLQNENQKLRHANKIYSTENKKINEHNLKLQKELNYYKKLSAEMRKSKSWRYTEKLRNIKKILD